MILAIDPGPIETGWALLHGISYEPFDFGKDKNTDLFNELNSVPRKEWMAGHLTSVVIEKPVCQRYSGSSISDTAVQAGIFAGLYRPLTRVYLITRSKVRGHFCGNKGNDSTIIKALVHRFAPDTPNLGKGHAKTPGYFYGFKADIWQAYALGVCFIDLRDSEKSKDIEYLLEGRIE